MRLKDRVCVVTGGASGIGLAIATAFDREGARVVILDIDMVAARAVADGLANGQAVSCDVSDSAAVSEAFDAVVERHGRVDVLVNNAGVVGAAEYARTQAIIETQARERETGPVTSFLRSLPNLSDELWHRMIATHLYGTFYCMRAAVQEMEKTGGVIINMSSINGTNGGFGNPHYATAKAAINGLTRATAKELIQQNIRVNAIAPGFVDTPLRDSISDWVRHSQLAATPIGRVAHCEEIASVAVFLACDESSYVVGQVISPNGGYLV